MAERSRNKTAGDAPLVIIVNESLAKAFLARSARPLANACISAAPKKKTGLAVGNCGGA